MSSSAISQQPSHRPAGQRWIRAPVLDTLQTLSCGSGFTPDGKTLYAVAWDKIVPISTATNTPGKPIPVRYGQPDEIVITP